MVSGVDILKGLEGQINEKVGLVKGLSERTQKAQGALVGVQQYSELMTSGLLDLYKGSSKKIIDAFTKYIAPGVALVQELMANPDTKTNGEVLKNSILKYKSKVLEAYKANSEEEVNIATYMLSKQLSATEALRKSVEELTTQELFE